MEALFEMFVAMGQLVIIMMVSALLLGLGYVIKQAIFRKKN